MREDGRRKREGSGQSRRMDEITERVEKGKLEGGRRERWESQHARDEGMEKEQWCFDWYERNH